jgi:hypothetical protein
MEWEHEKNTRKSHSWRLACVFRIQLRWSAQGSCMLAWRRMRENESAST